MIVAERSQQRPRRCKHVDSQLLSISQTERGFRRGERDYRAGNYPGIFNAALPPFEGQSCLYRLLKLVIIDPGGFGIQILVLMFR